MRFGERRFNISWSASLLYIDCDQSLKILRNSGLSKALQFAGLAGQDPSYVLTAAGNLPPAFISMLRLLHLVCAHRASLDILPA
jgi:hypothetical protein